jgi:uncharacterized membrane protein YhaH (DUF805 family)
MNEAERFLQQYEQKKNEPPAFSPSSPQSSQQHYTEPRPHSTYANPEAKAAGIFDGWWGISGRIGRKLYFQRWLVVLGGCAVLGAVLGVIGAVQISPVIGLFALPFMIPQHTRRLHDIGWSGWWQLINHIPFVGLIFWIFIFIKEGTPGPNKYDVDTAPEVFS